MPYDGSGVFIYDESNQLDSTYNLDEEKILNDTEDGIPLLNYSLGIEQGTSETVILSTTTAIANILVPQVGPFTGYSIERAKYTTNDILITSFTEIARIEGLEVTTYIDTIEDNYHYTYRIKKIVDNVESEYSDIQYINSDFSDGILVNQNLLAEASANTLSVSVIEIKNIDISSVTASAISTVLSPIMTVRVDVQSNAISPANANSQFLTALVTAQRVGDISVIINNAVSANADALMPDVIIISPNTTAYPFTAIALANVLSIREQGKNWKYGNYEFKVNPKNLTTKTTRIGDEIITQSGKYISLPTAFETKQEFVLDFYQPSSRKIYDFSLPTNTCFAVCYDKSTDKYYLGDYDTGNIYIKEAKWNTEKTITLLSGKKVRGLEVGVDGYLWVYIYTGITNTGELIKINPNTETQVSSITNIIDNGYDIAISEDKAHMYVINLIGKITKVSLSTGQQSVYCDIGNGTDNYIGLSFDGTYYWTYNKTESKFYQIDMARNKKINSCETKNTNENIIGNVSVMDKYLVHVNNLSGKLEIYRPNTVLADKYKLEQEIMRGNVILRDDLGIENKVSIESYMPRRVEGSEVRYEIELGVSFVS